MFRIVFILISDFYSRRTFVRSDSDVGQEGIPLPVYALVHPRRVLIIFEQVTRSV